MEARTYPWCAVLRESLPGGVSQRPEREDLQGSFRKSPSEPNDRAGLPDRWASANERAVVRLDCCKYLPRRKQSMERNNG